MGSAGAASDAAELRRTALAFDDALALLDRRLRAPVQDVEAEGAELARLEAQVADMDKACAASEAGTEVGPEVRVWRTRIAIYGAELRRLRERIRVRAARREEAERRAREGQGGGESDVAVALMRAHRQADELLDEGGAAGAALAAQRAHVEQALHDALSVQALLAGAADLLGGVQRSRARQTLLLALLVALCVCVFLYYHLRQVELVSG